MELTNSVGLWVDSLFGFQIRCTQLKKAPWHIDALGLFFMDILY
jgi:hypothetical protein